MFESCAQGHTDIQCHNKNLALISKPVLFLLQHVMEKTVLFEVGHGSKGKTIQNEKDFEI